MATAFWSGEMLAWLQKAGVDTSLSRRVVIDIGIEPPVKIYIEKYGSKEMLIVEPPPELQAATIRVLEKPTEAPE
jgi:hypothetical protein